MWPHRRSPAAREREGIMAKQKKRRTEKREIAPLDF